MIYDAVYKLHALSITDNMTERIISTVIQTIQAHIALLRPTDTVIIAFDGVAPVAKLDQQRSRRFKSYYINNVTKSIRQKEEPNPWNTTAITPGTQFMKRLNERVQTAFMNATDYNTTNILFSGSNVVGEGEHKIFEHIRKEKEQHQSKNTVIYGLDADLIMLSINHLPISSNIYLFRETPEFIQSINIELEPNEHYLLDIPQLANAIITNMNNDHEVPYEQQMHTLYDYIFMCFMLGNDFMPHFPAINIRTGGIDKLLDAYKQTIGGTNQHLTNGTKIHWNNVRKLIGFLAENENAFLKQEHKLRDKKEKFKTPGVTPESKLHNFTQLPTFDRGLEKYINPYKQDWQTRYYKSLFDMEMVDTERKKQICINYLEGLEWTMKYYTTGCPDWRWSYQYYYPPLITDLVHYIPVFDTEFIQNKPANPVSDIVQLCYVLPRESLQFLPEDLCKQLIREKIEWYNTNCQFYWAYCKYFWESHPDLPHIDIHELEQFVDTYYKTLS
jgi:5'-3' exonuclease